MKIQESPEIISVSVSETSNGIEVLPVMLLKRDMIIFIVAANRERGNGWRDGKPLAGEELRSEVLSWCQMFLTDWIYGYFKVSISLGDFLRAEQLVDELFPELKAAEVRA